MESREENFKVAISILKMIVKCVLFLINVISTIQYY